MTYKNQNKKDFSVVLLAAGESKRMGILKGLLEYKGRPFLQYQLESLLELGIEKIIVVLGRTYEQYYRSVSILKKITVVRNENVEKGQFYSLQCGLKKASKMNLQGVFVLPLDVVCPNKETWIKLISAINDYSVIVPRFEGRKGHPVYLSSEFINHLLSISSDKRLDYEIRSLEKDNKVKIAANGEKVVTMPLPAILVSSLWS